MTTEHSDSERVKTLVRAQLEQIDNPLLREALGAFLIEPVLQLRKWDYSLTEEMFPCWIVADFKNRNLGLAYSEYGHGNRGDCWGVVLLSENRFGRDDSWFTRLEDSFINSGFWEGPLPDDYEIPQTPPNQSKLEQHAEHLLSELRVHDWSTSGGIADELANTGPPAVPRIAVSH